MRDMVQKFIDDFERHSIGMNRLLPNVHTSMSTNYPPLNVIKTGEGKYVIEMALAGYKREDISIDYGNNFVTIQGKRETQDDKDYIYHGIASRSFKRQIPVASGVEVTEAHMKDGILSVSLYNKEAEVRTIPVL